MTMHIHYDHQCPQCGADFIRDSANGFVTATLPLGDGIEYSVKL